MTSEELEVAVVGGGIAGMTVAARLAELGLEVAVFEKSRGPGGRSSSRRQEPLRFDHGAPFFAAKDPEFSEVLRTWVDRALVVPWPTRFAHHTSGGERRLGDAQPYLAVPKMSALARAIGSDLCCHYSTRIQSLRPNSDRSWSLESIESQTFRAQAVVLTAPPFQSLALLQDYAPQISAALREVEVAPDWTLMLSGAPDLVEPGIGWVDFSDHPCLSRLIAEHRKPQRPASPAWTLHARGDWSREYLEQSPEWVAQRLSQALSEALGQNPRFDTIKAHRWRYARVQNPISPSFLADPKAGLYYGGDACLSADLESAFLSGTRAAKAIQRDLKG